MRPGRANSSLLAAHPGRAGAAKPASLERCPGSRVSVSMGKNLDSFARGETQLPLLGDGGVQAGLLQPWSLLSSHSDPGSGSAPPPPPPTPTPSTLQLLTWEKLLVPKTRLPGLWAARLQAPFCLTAGDRGPGRSSAQICVNEAGPQLGVVTQPGAHGCQVLAGFWFFNYSGQVGTCPGLL